MYRSKTNWKQIFYRTKNLYKFVRQIKTHRKSLSLAPTNLMSLPHLSLFVFVKQVKKIFKTKIGLSIQVYLKVSKKGDGRSHSLLEKCEYFSMKINSSLEFNDLDYPVAYRATSNRCWLLLYFLKLLFTWLNKVF